MAWGRGVGSAGLVGGWGCAAVVGAALRGVVVAVSVAAIRRLAVLLLISHAPGMCAVARLTEPPPSTPPRRPPSPPPLEVDCDELPCPDWELPCPDWELPWFCFPPPSSPLASCPMRLLEPPPCPLLPPWDCFPPPRSPLASCPTRLLDPPPWPFCLPPPVNALSAKPCGTSVSHHETARRCTHSETASTIAGRAIDASCAIAEIRTLGSIGRLVIWVRIVSQCAVVGARSDGGLAGGEIPLRDASTDLHVYGVSVGVLNSGMYGTNYRRPSCGYAQ